MPNTIEYTRSVPLVLMLICGVSSVSIMTQNPPYSIATGQHTTHVENDIFDFDQLDQQLEDSGAHIGGQEKEPGSLEVMMRRIGMSCFLFLIWCSEMVSACCSRLYTAVMG